MISNFTSTLNILWLGTSEATAYRHPEHRLHNLRPRSLEKLCLHAILFEPNNIHRYLQQWSTTLHKVYFDRSPLINAYETWLDVQGRLPQSLQHLKSFEVNDLHRA
jgi:hypothetical protein